MSPKDDPKPKDASVVSVNVEDYTKTRDSVSSWPSSLARRRRAPPSWRPALRYDSHASVNKA